MQKKRILIASILFLIWSRLQAEVVIYQSTENTGLNKLDRIDAIEKYLIGFTTGIKSMETKLDENSKKIKSMEDSLKSIKDYIDKQSIKIPSDKLETKAPHNLSETDKLKEDILLIKNKDIEKMKNDFLELSDTVKAIQATIRSQQ